MVSGTIFHCRKQSWPPEEYVNKGTLQLLEFDNAGPPRQAWRRRLNSHANRLKEFSVTFMEAVKMLQLGIRLWSYVREEASHGRKAPIDPFTRESCKPSASQGVPLGGMGSGSISRGFRGDFRQWQIVPGLCESSPVMANQFSIFISRDRGNKKYSSVLALGQHEELGKSGDKKSGDKVTGRVSSGEPDPELKISCRQISPFIPNNYRESSLPTSVFVYTLVNTGKERAKVSLLFTWAWRRWRCWRSSSSQASVNLSLLCYSGWTAKGNPPVTFAIAACETQNVNVTILPCFSLSEEAHVTAKDIWGKMAEDGHFDREHFSSGPSIPSSSGDTICAAVAASAWVEPHGKCTVAFALAWSSPKIKFLKGNTYHRRYTKFYGTSERSVTDLVHDALMSMWWEEEIEKWQAPILRDERLPEWYKFTLFNELYFLVAGGTVWTGTIINGEGPTADEKSNFGGSHHIPTKSADDSVGTTGAIVNDKMQSSVELTTSKTNLEDDDEKLVPRSSSLETRNGYSNAHDDDENVGKFLYLEGVEYIMWCTYDVHFYASFALLALFPKIELSIQRDFAKAVLFEDMRKVKFLADGNWGVRKVKGAVPHDLGTHDPWLEMNAYNIHDTSKWKDLNPKFVLQVYRDFAATGDMSFGMDVWPAVRAAIEYMEQFDRDGDGLTENDGFPDQTYDAWTVHGISAYCGCLWLAALQAAAAMANRLGDKAFEDKCRSKFQKAKPVFEEKLWNGSYFNYDSGASNSSKSIQADQLAGQWYIASSGLPPLFDDSKIRSALQKIFDFNVMKVRGGHMGAVNGMYPNGKVDDSCMQSREIWTGVTYSVAATMLLSQMEREGFTTAEGIFIAGWSEDGFGYWFQTPEGWTMDGHYRSLLYMRPLAIWAMQWALSPPKAILEAPKINMMDRTQYTSPFNSRNNESGVRKVGKYSRCFGGTVFHCDC
ncbi:hypothetical protein ACLOJK_011342 [Asimina triloba]